MTFKIQVKPKKVKCTRCRKADGIIKFYLPVGALVPKPYHVECFNNKTR